MKVIVVGAGVIGALTAYQLARQGAQVTVVDAGQPAAAASGASFGWINASFYLNDHHYALRFAAMAAHRRLVDTLGHGATLWQGCLCWEEQGAAFDAQYQASKALGYDVRVVDQSAFRQLEPEIAAPERALYFAQEGAVDLVRLTEDALVAAMALGARLLTGVTVRHVEISTGRVCGVRWSGGVLPADHVVLAAGTATETLLRPLDVPLPMLSRPGLILRSAPIAPLLSHILVSPGQEVRQDATGRVLAPLAASHQSDTTERIDTNPEALADQAVARLSALLQRDITWEQVAMAERPVPGDSLPVIGACGPDGLYVTTMHSGATLAPLVAEIAANEVTGQSLSNSDAALVAPYRPQRFKE